MKVTVLDVRQRQFQTVMRGYDRAEVNTFLAEVADEYEKLFLENDRLKQDSEKLRQETERLKQEATKYEGMLNDQHGQERNLGHALLMAQKVAEEVKEKAKQEATEIKSKAVQEASEIKGKAEQEAQRLISDGEARSEALVQDSRNRLEEMQRETETLAAKRRDVETSLHGIISTLQTAIDSVRKYDEASLDAKKALPTAWTPTTVRRDRGANKAETLTS